MYRARKDKKEFHISEDQVKAYKNAGYEVEEINEEKQFEPPETVERPAEQEKTKVK